MIKDTLLAEAADVLEQYAYEAGGCAPRYLVLARQLREEKADARDAIEAELNQIESTISNYATPREAIQRLIDWYVMAIEAAGQPVAKVIDQNQRLEGKPQLHWYSYPPVGTKLYVLGVIATPSAGTS